MVPCHHSLYLGRENEAGYADFIAEDAFYCTIAIEEGFSKELGKMLLADLREKIAKPVESLYAFELLIMDAVKQANVPAHFSLSACYRKGDMVYLKTTGTGQLYLKRGDEFARLIAGDNSASGYVHEDDVFILTTEGFTETAGGEKHLKQLFADTSMEKNTEKLNSHFENKEDKGLIALILLFTSRQLAGGTDDAAADKEYAQPVGQRQPGAGRMPFIPAAVSALHALQAKASHSPVRRLATMAAVFVILILLIWSVFAGVKRRSESELNQKIESSRQIIEHKLAQADDISALNLATAVALMGQAKDELNTLKKAAGDRSNKQISLLEESIRQKEEQITKKEEKNYQEFFDLTVDNKAAKGDRMALDGENALVLDGSRGVIYVLSLTQKSLEPRTAAAVKKARFMTKIQDAVYFYVPDTGVLKIDSDNAVSKAVAKDADWGSIADMRSFNGNLYLLDAAKNSIYKYAAIDTGFGAKSGYFKGGPVSLTESNSLAIDSSVYIGFSDGILKFTSGLADTFKTSFPEPGVNLTKVITTADLDNVYAWDKSKGSVYVLNKSGTYQKQIRSEILKKAQDAVVYGGKVFVLFGPKIYFIAVD